MYKNPKTINKAEGKFVTSGDEWPIVFHNIPDMTKYFNTISPGSWVWDLDSQAMNDYMALHEEEAAGDTMKIYGFYERYLNVLKQTEDPYWFTNKNYKHLDRETEKTDETNKAENAAQAEGEAKDDRDPLPLHHENCPKVGNGLSWTWTPKKYAPEGTWVTCSKCKKGFKVHYSEERAENAQKPDSEMGEDGSSGGSDLMREGYRGTELKHGQGEKTGSITVDLNTTKEDLPGQKPQDPIVKEDEAMAAAEDLAADAVNMFLDLVHNPEKLIALESDPDAMRQFKQLMNTEIPAVDPQKVILKASMKKGVNNEGSGPGGIA